MLLQAQVSFQGKIHLLMEDSKTPNYLAVPAVPQQEEFMGKEAHFLLSPETVRL